MWRKTSPAWSMALLGMHPTLRHAPPMAPASMQQVLAPRRAARMAAT